jgi:hypothetical protein
MEVVGEIASDVQENILPENSDNIQQPDEEIIQEILEEA